MTILLGPTRSFRRTNPDMLLDTSGLLGCLDAAEVRHHDAITYFEAGSLKLTHNYVLVEFVALAHNRSQTDRRVRCMERTAWVGTKHPAPSVSR